MSGALKIWTGLLRAGALALALILFGFAGTAAHAHAPMTAVAGQHHHAGVTADCHQHEAMAVGQQHGHAHHGAAGVGDCCGDDCGCGCALMCASHIVAGVPMAVATTMPALSGKLLPSTGLDPAGLTTPPEPRPPLSI